MRIRLDDSPKGNERYLCADANCCWIVETRVSEKTGKVTEKKLAGYCGKLSDLFTGYLHKRLREDEAQNLKELAEHINNIESDIKKIMSNLTFKDLKED